MGSAGRWTGIASLMLGALLLAGCASTPQPPSASGQGATSAAPTGTAVPSATGTGGSTAAPTTPATGSDTAGGATSSSSSSSGKPGATTVGTEPPTGKSLPPGWPGVPLPPGTITTAERQGGSQTVWTVNIDSPGTVDAVLNSLLARYQAAGWTVAGDITIPNAGRVLTTKNAKYGVSVMGRGRNGQAASVETLVRTLA